MSASSLHSFHIPIMGTAFTIDTPLKVARYGISSVLSLVDDGLIEQMRRYHCEQAGEPYQQIGEREEDARARRVTAYLDLLDRLVARQVEELRAAPFEPGSDITRYFELLPESPARREYQRLLETHDPAERAALEAELREWVVPGRIDVNVMTKVDADVTRTGEALPPGQSHALAALRGFARSCVRGAVVLSAGLNPRLFSYAAEFDDFFPDENGEIRKEIVLKVSDYRSAQIQGKTLAKRGVWVSEYRIESGLNCGGHAFATKGHLLGPILDEFKQNRRALPESLLPLYNKALEGAGRPALETAPEVRITVQGGIGTAAENRLLLERFGADATGWATPFLLVPEVTNVDDDSLEKLAAATGDDVYLSNISTLGVPFWTLRDSASERAKRARAESGRPGSPCVKGYTLFNTEFGDAPLCLAARAYQRQKLVELEKQSLTPSELESERERIIEKSCICHDLAGGATLKLGIDEKATPAVCPGPGIVDFARIVSLDEMVGHIYGREDLISNLDRPHMFVRELELYVDNLRQENAAAESGSSDRRPKYLHEFKQQLLEGIDYYRELVPQLRPEEREAFELGLSDLSHELESIPLVEA
jgi:hypothetical protein